MIYAVVADYNKDTKMCVVCMVTGEPELELVSPNGYSVVHYDALAQFVLTNGYKPMNFDVEDGKVKEFCSFDRFSSKRHAVILAEFIKTSGKTSGYRILTPKCVVINKRKAELLTMISGVEEPFFQNGIVANGAIKCYPSHPFIQLKDSSKQSARAVSCKSSVDGVKTPISKSKQESTPVTYDEQQTSEISKAKKNGVDPSIIKDPRLNDKQMRVLWVAKKNGALSEYFNNPELSVDSMKWYADRIFSETAAKARSNMLQHPSLSLAQLDELEHCIADGVEYVDICDENISVGEMQVKRIERTEQLWGSLAESDATDGDIIVNAIDYVERKLRKQ